MPNPKGRRRGEYFHKRDEEGWRVPWVGTKSYEVYCFAVLGWSNKEIAAELGYRENTVAVLRWKFSNPEEANARSRGGFVPYRSRGGAQEF